MITPTAASASTKNREPASWLSYYKGGITFIGIALLIYSLVNLPEDLAGVLAFAALAAIAKITSGELQLSSQHNSIDIAAAVAVAAVMTFGPAAGVLAQLVAGLVDISRTGLQSDSGDRPIGLQHSLFNTAMMICAVFMAGQVYLRLGGQVGNTLTWINAFPLVGAVAVEAAVVVVLLVIRDALSSGTRIDKVWKGTYSWTGPIAFTGGLVGGSALALAYQMFGMLGMLVFSFPMLATNYSFRMYVAHSKTYVEQLEKANADLDNANLGLLETLGAVIDAYDIYTYGHSRQVAVYASALAQRLGYDEDHCSRIVRAALVHDLGKVAIEDYIIRKKERLTVEEYNLLKRHPAIGAEIISRMKGLQELIPMVRYHHERWDGKGYPEGLKGDQIPMDARILSLADALDAMFSDRPYRPTRSYKEVMGDVAQASGAQFDPELVEIFFQMASEMGRGFFKNSAAAVDRTVQMDGVPLMGRLDRHMKKSLIPDNSARKK